jgi:AraC-like DNA-binding protein
MAYRELPPPPALAGVVRCLWMREATDAEEVLVTPDGCVDVVVRDGHAFVAGPDTAPVWSHVPPGSITVGVRLRAGTAAAALGVPADELRDRRVALEDLRGAAGRRVGGRAGTDPALLVAALADPLGRGADPRVVGAVRLLAGTPELPIPAVAGAVGLGERQLRRAFTHAVGYGPRTFARVARFRRALVLLRRGDPLARAAADAGYADQAHMTREVRALAGRTPTALARDAARPTKRASNAVARP